MKQILLALILSFVIFVPASAQKRKPAARPHKTPAADKEPVPPSLVGSQVTLTPVKGDPITGELVALDAASVKIKTATGQSATALNTLANITFGAAGTTPAGDGGSSTKARHPDFNKNAGEVLNAFQTMIAGLKAGADYTDYGRQVAELRRAAERFVGRYSASEDPTEVRAAALVAGALTDYTWARTLWTLKLGKSGEVLVVPDDSPVVADSLALYPELKVASASGEKYSAEKLIGGLWRQAAIKVEQLRKIATVG